MAKPKFDYNGDAFYDEIEQLAKQGQKDSEIAYALGLKFGVDLNPQVFNRMKTENTRIGMKTKMRKEAKE